MNRVRLHSALAGTSLALLLLLALLAAAPTAGAQEKEQTFGDSSRPPGLSAAQHRCIFQDAGLPSFRSFPSCGRCPIRSGSPRTGAIPRSQAGSVIAPRSWRRLKIRDRSRARLLRLHHHGQLRAAGGFRRQRHSDSERDPQRQDDHPDFGRLHPAGDGQRPIPRTHPHGDCFRRVHYRGRLQLSSPDPSRLRQSSGQRLFRVFPSRP